MKFMKKKLYHFLFLVRKTHHLPMMHDMTVSTPSATGTTPGTCSITVNTTPALNAAGAQLTTTATITSMTPGLGTTLASGDSASGVGGGGACVPGTPPEQPITTSTTTTYRLTTAKTSLKRQKSNSCASVHLNGHEQHNLVTHMPHQHAHPHRSTMIKQHHHHHHHHLHHNHHNHQQQQQQQHQNLPHHLHRQSTIRSCGGGGGCSGSQGKGICSSSSRKSGEFMYQYTTYMKYTDICIGVHIHIRVVRFIRKKIGVH